MWGRDSVGRGVVLVGLRAKARHLRDHWHRFDSVWRGDHQPVFELGESLGDALLFGRPFAHSKVTYGLFSYERLSIFLILFVVNIRVVHGVNSTYLRSFNKIRINLLGSGVKIYTKYKSISVR